MWWMNEYTIIYSDVLTGKGINKHWLNKYNGTMLPKLKKKKIEKPKAQWTHKKFASIQRDVAERGNFSFLKGKNYCSTQTYLQLPIYGTHVMVLKLIFSAVACFHTNCTCKYSTKWSGKPQTSHTVWQQVSLLCHIQVVPDLNLLPWDQIPWPRSWLFSPAFCSDSVILPHITQ